MRDSAAILAVMAREGDAFGHRLRTAEAAEAFRAFAERRAPDFTKIQGWAGAGARCWSPLQRRSRIPARS
jgi:hypothetical protein